MLSVFFALPGFYMNTDQNKLKKLDFHNNIHMKFTRIVSKYCVKQKFLIK